MKFGKKLIQNAEAFGIRDYAENLLDYGGLKKIIKALLDSGDTGAIAFNDIAKEFMQVPLHASTNDRLRLRSHTLAVLAPFLPVFPLSSRLSVSRCSGSRPSTWAGSRCSRNALLK